MSKFTELKQYLEKEIQAKRFLTEGLEVLTNIDSLDQLYGESVNRTEAAMKQETQALQKAEVARADLDKILASQKDVLAEIEKDLKAATDKANMILSAAKLDVQLLVEEEEAKMKEAKADRKEVKAEIAELTKQRNALKDELSALDAERERVLKKFTD